MKNKKTVCWALAALLLILTACGAPAAPAAPAATEAPAENAGPVSFTAGGLMLTVPAELADQLIVETDVRGLLFSVSEKASVEAVKAREPEAELTAGPGWLFGVSRLSEEELHELLCGDMSGRDALARGADGNCYLWEHPTDVRIERERDITPADMEQWGALNEWAASCKDAFTAENGLTPLRYSNTSLDMALARIAWQGDTDYTLADLSFGERMPADESEGAAFAQEILSQSVFTWQDGEQGPDGEYTCLHVPALETRFDFFHGGDGSYVREVHGDWETLYRAEGVDLTEIVGRWYEALTARPQTAYDQTAYQAAVDAVLEEYRSLDDPSLGTFVEAERPELPWYTAILANTTRNDLFYGFYDFDGNGMPELIIAAGDETWQQPMGIYAFDGEKMVYLCKDQALGERSTVAYRDGLFFVHGSGGAAVGSVTVWRIAPDGCSTEFVEVLNYEYKDASNVEYTTRFGNMTPEEITACDYLDGFGVPVDYTLFAPRTGESVIGMPNPWTEAASPQEAAAVAGLEGFTPPEYLSAFPGDWDVLYRGMAGLAEAVYDDGERHLVIRKGLGTDLDVSGDFNTYDQARDVVWKGLTIHCFGTGGEVRLARWSFGGNSYSLRYTAEVPGLSESDVTSLVNQVQ